MQDLKLSIVSTDRQLWRALAVRIIVFVQEQGVSIDHELDEHECTALHLIGEVGGEPVAAARLRVVDGWAKLERIAVRREQRGKGLGHQLVRRLLDEARAQGLRHFRLHAQAHLTGFYAEHGFVVEGEPFEEEGIAHVLMLRKE